MKMLATYLEAAISFEQMAAKENNADLKAHLRRLAEAYRRAAALRAEYLSTITQLPKRPDLVDENYADRRKQSLRGGV